MARDVPTPKAPSADPKPTSSAPTASVHTAKPVSSGSDPTNRQGGTVQGVSHPGTITGMIKGAEKTPKVYTNHANHPGHTTVGFNKQKVEYAAIKPEPKAQETLAAIKPEPSSPPDPVAAISPLQKQPPDDTAALKP